MTLTLKKKFNILLTILLTTSISLVLANENQQELFSPPPFTVRWELKMGTPMVSPISPQTKKDLSNRESFGSHLVGIPEYGVNKKESGQVSEAGPKVNLQFGRTDTTRQPQFKMIEKTSNDKRDKSLEDIIKNYNSSEMLKSFTNLFDTEVHLNIEF
ncbi:MAG: hypothetical protein N2317_04445 [Syntrophales bacterium]|nr:hypothetical protein [Syntrophales bacterium]